MEIILDENICVRCLAHVNIRGKETFRSSIPIVERIFSNLDSRGGVTGREEEFNKEPDMKVALKVS
jgi:hypothetical protein